MRDVEPDVVIMIGDLFDCEQISKYHHNPYKLRIIQDSVRFAHEDVIAPIRRASRDCGFVFILGNHENRVNTFCDNFIAPLGGRDFVNINALLKLEFADEVVPYMNHYQLCPGTMLTHGHYVNSASGATIKKHMQFCDGNLLIGHTHRIGRYGVSKVGGPVVGWEIGHMTNGTTVPGCTPVNNWQSSPGTVITYSADGSFADFDVLEVGGKRQDMVRCSGETYRIRRR